MYKQNKLWGEVPQRRYKIPVNQDISDVIRQAKQIDCLSNYSIVSGIQERRDIVLPPMNPQMIYAAELHKYKNTMANIINDAELAVEFNLILQKPFPEVIKPEKPGKNVEKENKSFNYLENRQSNFTKGVKIYPPYITAFTRKNIIRKSVATLCTQIGFSKSYQNVVDTLTDVVEEFYRNIGRQLRASNDSSLNGRGNQFPDIVDQVFTQSGLGGIQGIYDYYENRVRKYQILLENRCEDLANKHNALVMPTKIKQEIKEEIVDDETTDDQDVILHLTNHDGEEDYLKPFLQSGFQMLNTLEEEELKT